MALALLSLVLVLAWDFHRKWRQREKEALRLIAEHNQTLFCIEKFGRPANGLYSWLYDGEPPENWQQEHNRFCNYAQQIGRIAGQGYTVEEFEGILRKFINPNFKDKKWR